MFIVKIILGLGMIAFLYFFSTKLFESKEQAVPQDGFEIEVDTNQ